MSITELQEECLVALPMRYETDLTASAIGNAFNTAVLEMTASFAGVGALVQVGEIVQVAPVTVVAFALDVHPSFTFNFG